MEKVYIKNHLQFIQRIKKGMIFRRTWHYKSAQPLDRVITDVQVNGFWVKEEGVGEPMWVDFMRAKDWAFENEKIYMLFNHDLDLKRKKNELNEEDFERYLDRHAKYVEKLEQTSCKKMYDYKVLGTYEILSE